MDLMGMIKDFAKQSRRVLTITHKPRPMEYRQMALTTGIGMIIVGVIGFIISMAAFFLRS